MKNSWIEKQWEELQRQIQLCVDYQSKKSPDRADAISGEASEFSSQPTPDRYPDLLQRVRDAAQMAIRWQSEVGDEESSEAAAGTDVAAESAESSAGPVEDQAGDDNSVDPVQEAGEESFPASDPPSWNKGTA